MQAAVAGFSPNYSGFSSFPLASVYPNMGNFSQTEETIPEPAEQAQYTNGDANAPVAVDAASSRNIMLLLILGFVLLAVFAR